MTTYANKPAIIQNEAAKRPMSKGQLFVKIITTTDHKMIGYMYLVTTFAWFLIGGLLAVPIAAAVLLIIDEVVFPRADNS